MATSTDGITWTALPGDTFSTKEYSSVSVIVYGNGRFVVGGYTDISELMTSGKMICLPAN